MWTTLRAHLMRSNHQPGLPISGAANVPPSILVLQEVGQEADVFHGEPQNFVLAQLLVWRVGRDELTELREGPVHVLLSPTFPTVGEDATHNLWLAGYKNTNR